MKKTNIPILVILVSSIGVCWGQGGIYSVCDPQGKYQNVLQEWRSLPGILGDNIKDITIIASPGWKDAAQAKEQLLAKLRDPQGKASSLPLWNLDTPLELEGTIEYRDGTQGKVAVAQHRVGFQDSAGKPWYFEWTERWPRN